MKQDEEGVKETYRRMFPSGGNQADHLETATVQNSGAAPLSGYSPCSGSRSDGDFSSRADSASVDSVGEMEVVEEAVC